MNSYKNPNRFVSIGTICAVFVLNRLVNRSEFWTLFVFWTAVRRTDDPLYKCLSTYTYSPHPPGNTAVAWLTDIDVLVIQSPKGMRNIPPVLDKGLPIRMEFWQWKNFSLQFLYDGLTYYIPAYFISLCCSHIGSHISIKKIESLIPVFCSRVHACQCILLSGI